MTDLPVPVVDDLGRPYWSATQRGVLSVQACGACGHHFLYPRELCPRCWSSDLDWVPIAGRGQVVACTVVHQATDVAFVDRVPYVLAVVRLAEGAQLMANIVDCPPGSVTVGREVRVVFENRGDIELPQFTPVADEVPS